MIKSSDNKFEASDEAFFYAQNIVFFDGICNLCNFWVDFLMKKDPVCKLKYSSLQSDFAQNFLKQFEIRSLELDSIVFYSNQRVFTKSEAIIKIFNTLNIYPVFKVFGLLPKGFNDVFYELLAKNRYKLWGKKDFCRIPADSEKERFI
jgi:predicted DCC family thiol-disulfide oxidoreductase YuxK